MVIRHPGNEDEWSLTEAAELVGAAEGDALEAPEEAPEGLPVAEPDPVPLGVPEALETPSLRKPAEDSAFRMLVRPSQVGKTSVELVKLVRVAYLRPSRSDFGALALSS